MKKMGLIVILSCINLFIVYMFMQGFMVLFIVPVAFFLGFESPKEFEMRHKMDKMKLVA